MTYKIVVTPEASLDIENATNYYKKNASNKVAEHFLEDYRQTFKAIQTIKYFQIYFQDFRAKPLKKFPFIVFYTIDERLKTIFIKPYSIPAKTH